MSAGVPLRHVNLSWTHAPFLIPLSLLVGTGGRLLRAAVWVLELELGSSGRAVSAPKLKVIILTSGFQKDYM